MEQTLITLTIRTRVEPDPNKVLKVVLAAKDHKGRLWVLGQSGSRRALQGSQVDAFGTSERYMKAAQYGLLYYEALPEQSEVWAFAPGVDPGTKLPVLLERYDVAFAKRSHEGAAAQEEKQAEMELKSEKP